MRRTASSSIVAAGIALALAAGAAQAYTCVILVDAKDTVVYRDSVPPVDLSERGTAARDALYRRGEQLMILDLEHCVPLRSTGARVGTASVDEIVAGLRSASGPDNSGATPRSGGVYAPMPTDVGITPAAQEAAAIRGAVR